MGTGGEGARGRAMSRDAIIESVIDKLAKCSATMERHETLIGESNERIQQLQKLRSQLRDVMLVVFAELGIIGRVLR